MERSMVRNVFFITSRLIRGDWIAQKMCGSLTITAWKPRSLLFFLFHLFSVKSLILFLSAHMWKIYIKMLSSQSMDLIKYNQSPDFTFDVGNWSYEMFKYMNDKYLEVIPWSHFVSLQCLQFESPWWWFCLFTFISLF